jgi:hypothetical protein
MNDQDFARHLRPGDVLLSLGTGTTSEAIRMLDGGEYSHAALWTGSTVIESTTPCVMERTFAKSLADHDRAYVRAYRHRKCHGERAALVISGAREYVDRTYSYGDLFLCASLMAVASYLPTKAQLSFLKQACEVAHFLSEDRARDGEHVTCTQLVVRAYAFAGLSLRIQPTGAVRFGAKQVLGAVGELAASKDDGDEALAEWIALQDALRAKCVELTGAPGADVEKGPLKRWDKVSPVEAENEWRSNLVTPRNLQSSVDLEFVGEIYPRVRLAAGATEAWSD